MRVSGAAGSGSQRPDENEDQSRAAASERRRGVDAFRSTGATQPSICIERGLVMRSTIAVPTQHLPLPYVPELPADFVLMLKSTASQLPH